MKRDVSVGLLCLVLAACESSGVPNFERMNEAELAAWNQGKPIHQMIVCSENTRSFSRVRRRRCMTVEAAYGSAQQAMQLGVLNTIPGYSQTE